MSIYSANPHVARDGLRNIGPNRADSVYRYVDEFLPERLVDIKSPDDANTAVGDPAMYGAQYTSGDDFAATIHEWKNQDLSYIERHTDLPNWPFIVLGVAGVLALRELYSD